MSLLDVKNLSISFHSRDGVSTAVNDVSFSVDHGQTLGIVGESGSGKSVTCYALLGLIPMPPGAIESGSAHFDGEDLLQMNESQLRKIRGQRISMIFQDPMTSLNPFMRIGQQIAEPLRFHSGLNEKEARLRSISLLKEVGISDAEKRYSQYPHEFSGGMRQRVMIAMALITEPELLIADEPTTALDVTIQAQILELIQQLQKKRNIAVIFISHDLDVVKHMADHVLVMQQGEMVEQGPANDVFLKPQQDYTQRLIASIPDTAKPQQYLYQSNSEDAAPILKIEQVSISYPDQGQRFTAVDRVSLELRKGEVLGLVGESGCGKTTLSQSIVRLVDIDQGSIHLRDQPLHQLTGKALQQQRKIVQMIFQDPFASLNPRMTVFNIIAEPLKLHRIASGAIELKRQIFQLMDDVGLDQKWANKYPHEFSGGQRQRIAIARALAVQPKLVIADEPVSALDVTIQSQILELLLQLCQRYQLTMIFISHDLAVVRYIADRTAVMCEGKIVELNDTEQLYRDPKHEYTQKLLDARY